MKLLAMTLLILISSDAAAQQTYPRSRVCFTYAADLMTYHVAENMAYAAAAGAMPSPVPVVLK